MKNVPPPPGGFGPWFCAFIVNTATRPKKYTHVVAHTLPHLVVDALNRTAAATTTEVVPGKEKKRPREDNNNNNDCWIMVFKIGPFSHWADSVAFLNQWICKTRGKHHRMERGLELFSMYREQFHLCLWTQTRKRDEALEYYWDHQPVIETTLPTIASPPLLPEQQQEEKTQQQQFSTWIEETRSLFVNPAQPTLATLRSILY
jgi:hypothetical protein